MIDTAGSHRIANNLARVFYESPAATADITVLPGILSPRSRDSNSQNIRALRMKRLLAGHLLYKKWGARGLRLRCLSVYSQAIKSLFASNVLIPIPRTFIMSSGFSKGPFCFL